MLFVYVLSVFLFVCQAQAMTNRTIPLKKFRMEEICDGIYGTTLNNYFKINDKGECSVKCSKRSGCQSFTFNNRGGWCSLNSDVFLNRTMSGCTLIDYGEITTEDAIKHAPPPTHCGPVPFMSVILVDTSSGNYSIGAQLPYICTPCTYFPPVTSPGVITCGTDGRWTFPSDLCVYGPDVGYVRTGEAIPQGALGCGLEFNDTCANDFIPSGLRFFGNVTGYCYCDSACCGAGDCCFDSTCYSRERDFYDQYYYYDYY